MFNLIHHKFSLINKIVAILFLFNQMTSRFQSYAQDIDLLTSDIEAKLQSITQNQDPSLEKEILALLEESNDILDSMELEVQSLPTTERAPVNAQVRSIKSQMTTFKTQLNDALYTKNRNDLFGGNETSEGDHQQRQTLLSTNASIERSTQRLQDATRTALESENVGSSILSNLRTQRDQIINARDTLGDADNYVDRSLRTLGSMSRRLAQNKILTYGIIALLILLILLTLYSKFS